MYKWLIANIAVMCLLPWSARAQTPADGPPRASLGIGVERPDGAAAEKGVVVGAVLPDGPAARAGLKPGDVIVKADKQEIRSFTDLTGAISKHKPGDQLTLQVMRGGKQENLKVTLGEREAAPAARPEGSEPEGPGAGEAFLGVQPRPLTPEAKRESGVGADQGVIVGEVLPDSPADKAGLRQGDVITAVNKQAVADPPELRAAIHKAGAGKEVTLTVVRGKEQKEIKARLEAAPARPGLPRLGNPRLEGFPALPPPRLGDEQRRIQELERRVEELQRRVRDLEKKQPGPGASK